MTGSDKGKEGRVLKSYPVRNKILIEGINIVKKHVRPSQDNPQGGITEKEMPVDISNVALLFNGELTKVGYKTLDNNKKVRISKKTGEVIQ
jgi:large subunit ribosomal protein L24